MTLGAGLDWCYFLRLFILSCFSFLGTCRAKKVQVPSVRMFQQSLIVKLELNQKGPMSSKPTQRTLPGELGLGLDTLAMASCFFWNHGWIQTAQSFLDRTGQGRLRNTNPTLTSLKVLEQLLARVSCLDSSYMMGLLSVSFLITSGPAEARIWLLVLTCLADLCHSFLTLEEGPIPQLLQCSVIIHRGLESPGATSSS